MTMTSTNLAMDMFILLRKSGLRWARRFAEPLYVGTRIGWKSWPAAMSMAVMKASRSPNRMRMKPYRLRGGSAVRPLFGLRMIKPTKMSRALIDASKR